ncbi:MAG: BACON domain-containing protein, partial [Acidobacteriota bacterium]|nr:BACON domain-containing protein [Acidobacteriota bacterium]
MLAEFGLRFRPLHLHRRGGAVGGALAQLGGLRSLPLPDRAGRRGAPPKMTTAATRQSARIPARSGFFRLPASGAYTIEVTSFEALSAGDYTLRLSVTTCNYAVAPLQPPRYEAAGGSGSVTVSCADGCEWGAASQVSWITLTAGASGTGGGIVAFNVAPNTSAQGRSGTLSVAGQTVTITQTAAVASVSAASFGGA